MQVNYINFNGRMMVASESVLTVENRSFRYGDGLFETMLWVEGRIRLLNYHAERLKKGLKTLHIEGWEKFDEDFIYTAAKELITKNERKDRQVRLRLQVFRSGGGLY